MNLLAAILHPRITRLGYIESDGDVGMTYGHPDTLRSRAYDFGRSLGRNDD
jgi:hypothetical protein